MRHLLPVAAGLVPLVLSSCSFTHNKAQSEAAPLALVCDDFGKSAPGPIQVTLSGGNATIDWPQDLSATADSLTTSLSGPTAPAAVLNTKPATFASLADGTWTATVTYAKAGCDPRTTTRVFTVSSTADCSSWNALSLTPPAATVEPPAGASITWSGVAVGKDHIQVSLSGANSQGPVQDSKPAVFSGLAPGRTLASVVYIRNGCSDIVGSVAFTVPVSLSTHVFPVLASKCSGCHGSSGGFTIGSSASALYSALTSPANASCSPAAAHRDRVDPGADPSAPAQSFFYRKVSSTECGSRMASFGGLSSSEVSMISDWISQGAQEN